MKRTGFLYDKLLDPIVIEVAIKNASLGKRNRLAIRKVLDDLPHHISILKDMMENQTFKPSPYHVMMRYDHRSKKTRKIQRPIFFPDQCVHWLVVLAIQKVIMRGMYRHSCGSIPRRGIKHGVNMIKKWLKFDHKNTKYTLKMDIKKFYDNISHELLMKTVKSKIKDKKLLSLIQQIVDTTDSGVPIGNYTSQWFANLFLEKLDHFIKEKLRIKYYVRYIDDLVLFGNNKKVLHKARLAISNFLETELKLKLKENWQVFKTASRGVDFLGYVFYHDYTKLRARNFFALTRQCRKTKKLIARKIDIPFPIAAGLLSRAGQFKYFDSHNIRKKYFDGIKIKQLKKVVSDESKKQLSPSAYGIRNHRKQNFVTVS